MAMPYVASCALHSAHPKHVKVCGRLWTISGTTVVALRCFSYKWRMFDTGWAETVCRKRLLYWGKCKCMMHNTEQNYEKVKCEYQFNMRGWRQNMTHSLHYESFRMAMIHFSVAHRCTIYSNKRATTSIIINMVTYKRIMTLVSCSRKY